MPVPTQIHQWSVVLCCEDFAPVRQEAFSPPLLPKVKKEADLSSKAHLLYVSIQECVKTADHEYTVVIELPEKCSPIIPCSL